jgi:hypothetical protein
VTAALIVGGIVIGGFVLAFVAARVKTGVWPW